MIYSGVWAIDFARSGIFLPMATHVRKMKVKIWHFRFQIHNLYTKFHLRNFVLLTQFYARIRLTLGGKNQLLEQNLKFKILKFEND